MTKNTFILSLTLVVTGVAIAATPASASRNTCKKVYLSADNRTGTIAKVIDLDYQISGYGKKSEPIRNQEIPSGRKWGTERNLEQASGRSTYIIVKYRTRKTRGLGKWSKVKKVTSRPRNCHDRTAYNVVMR